MSKVLITIGVTSKEKAELASYQLREVSQVWYTRWKDDRPVELVPIEWEDFKESFLGKYFPHERREAKVGEFVHFRQGNVDIEESKHRRSTSNMKKGKSNEQNQPKFKKKAPKSIWD